MPAKRLPWFRFWIDATTHGKVRQLDDGTFRTWVELLDAAAKQPRRGRFDSRAEAVSIIRRPAKHLSTLVSAKLVDESSEGLVMHDWDEWQRWRNDDVIDSGTTSEELANDSATSPEPVPNNSRTTRERLAKSPSLRVSAEGDTDTDTERDIDDAPNGAAREPDPEPPKPVPKPNRSADVIDAIRALDIEPTLTERDHSAIKRSTAPPGAIAEVYGAVYRGEYGDDFMQKRLSVHEAIGWIDGYRSWKTNGAPRQTRNGRIEPKRPLIDRTGVEN